MASSVLVSFQHDYQSSTRAVDNVHGANGDFLFVLILLVNADLVNPHALVLGVP